MKNAGLPKRPCKACDGYGKTWCPGCGGQRYIVTCDSPCIIMRCHTCNSMGQITCDVCAGEGLVPEGNAIAARH
jgi:hypothetical protein